MIYSYSLCELTISHINNISHVIFSVKEKFRFKYEEKRKITDVKRSSYFLFKKKKVIEKRKVYSM